MKRSMKGDFNLFNEAEKIYTQIEDLKPAPGRMDDFFQEKMNYLRNFKKLALLAIHGATNAFGKQLVHEQEVLNNISDMIMEIYVSESLALRVKKIETMRGSADIYKDILDVNVYDAAGKIRKSATDAINSFAAADEAAKLLPVVDILTSVAPVNVKDARRRIADKLIEDNSYKF